MMNNRKVTLIWIALLLVLTLIGALYIIFLVDTGAGTVRFAHAAPAAPDTVVPVVQVFTPTEVRVRWDIIPDGFNWMEAVIYLEGPDDYKQEIRLEQPPTLSPSNNWWAGVIKPVPVSNFYYLSYGYITDGVDYYPIYWLPSDLTWIELYKMFVPMVAR